MQGLLVTGELISAWWWAAQLHEQQEAARGEQPKSENKTWREEFERRRDENVIDDAAWEAMSREEREENLLRKTPGFFHLQGASVVSGELFIPTAGTLWRGRLSQVDAWFPGKVGSAPSS